MTIIYLMMIELKKYALRSRVFMLWPIFHFAKCETLDSRALRHSSHVSQACSEINKEQEALGRLHCFTILEME